ncbi:MAG TPA: hypothetical protein PKD70_06110 [Saprospiraceae bacterium]|nr:hypothetical protein [Saprospiraceae bacterium]HMP13431.1 hypothetical protein [Saprospiraceae bacterium]
MNWKKLILAGAFIIAAAFCNAVMDKLQFHYSSSIFPRKGEILLGKSHDWWNPAVSWRNKYKNWPNDARPAFPFAKTALVFLTDAWHFAKCLMIILISAGVAIVTQRKPIHAVAAFFIYYAIFSIAFEFVFRWLLEG